MVKEVEVEAAKKQIKHYSHPVEEEVEEVEEEQLMWNLLPR